MFIVYTYFGRIIKKFPIPENETHHNTLDIAIKFMRTCGLVCWIKLK